MPRSNGACDPDGRRRRWRRRPSSSPEHHPYDYEYIIIPGGDRFDIPEGEDKQEFVQFFEEASRATREVIARHGDGRPADGINRAAKLPNCTHRDGSIYSVTTGWHRRYRISDTSESESISFFFTLLPNYYLGRNHDYKLLIREIAFPDLCYKSLTYIYLSTFVLIL
jgi:hypothetical protein